ncbi:MAG: hypothetical protein AAB536_00135 [Patescibacteria group bacterium]
MIFIIKFLLIFGAALFLYFLLKRIEAKYVFFILGAAGLILLFFLIRYELNLMSYPSAWELSENENVIFTQRIHSGEALYGPPDKSPYIFAVYPPFFYILSSAVTGFLGSPLLANRSVALLGALGTWLMAVLILKRLPHKNTSLVVLGGLMAFIPATVFLLFGRTDSLMLFLSLLNVLFSIKYIKEEQSRKKICFLLIAVFAALAAFFTKQAGLAAVCVVGGAVLLRFLKTRSFHWNLLAEAGIFLAGSGFALWIISETPYFFDNVFLFSNQIYGRDIASFAHLWDLMKVLMLQYGGIVAAAGFAIWFNFTRRRTKIGSEIFITGIWWLANLLLFVKLGQNEGAGITSFIPLLYASILLIPFSIEALIEKFGFNCLKADSLIVAFAIVYLVIQLTVFSGIRILTGPSPEDKQAASALIVALRKFPGDILTERLDAILASTGHKSLLEASSFEAISENGAFGNLKRDIYFSLNRDVASRRFSAIVTLGEESQLTRQLMIDKLYRQQAVLELGYAHLYGGKIKHILWIPARP